MFVGICVFAAKWLFHTCGATGPIGPTPSLCSSSYRKSNVNVTVGTKGVLKGIQMWRVPETGLYRYVLLGKIIISPYRNINQWSDGQSHTKLPIFILNCLVILTEFCCCCFELFCDLSSETWHVQYVFTLGFDLACLSLLWDL